MLKRLFKYTGYSTVDVKVSSKDKTVKILLERKSGKAFKCHKCGSRLERLRGHHRYELNELPVMDFKTTVMFWRYKGWCSKCQKTRNEHVDFIKGTLRCRSHSPFGLEKNSAGRHRKKESFLTL